MSEIADPREQMFVEKRPWGAFEQFVVNTPATVKIITVEPGHRLSLQTHAKRAEFWRVIEGSMDITVGDKSWTAQPGESVWISVGEQHRMGNSSDGPARIMEIGLGDFDESDIERLEDDYQR